MKYNVIAFEREYASGGSEIANLLAKKLNVECYEKEILKLACQKLKISETELEKIEETITSSFIYGVFMLSNLATTTPKGLTQAQQLSVVETQVIKEISEKGPCVIVGRCAAGILNDKKVLKVFIHADYEYRLKRAVNEYGIEQKKAKETISQKDKRRSEYFKAVSQKNWKDKEIYHLFINSAKVDKNEIVDMLYNLIV